MSQTITSLLLDEHYALGDSTPLVRDAFCPIDKTQLALIHKGDYRCVGCGAFYTSTSPSVLHDQAITYIRSLQQQAHADPFSYSRRLEKILAAAETNFASNPRLSQ